MKETETIEFKKSFAELKAGPVSIVAILNKHGAGELWFGVRNDGKTVGLDASEKSLRDLSQSIAAHIKPRIYPQVGIKIRDGANCVKISFNGKDAPYFAYGRASNKTSNKTSDKILSAIEKDIVKIIEANQIVTQQEIAGQLNLSYAGIRYHTDKLKAKRILQRVGGKKSGRWVVTL